jgi:hypothetical protein
MMRRCRFHSSPELVTNTAQDQRQAGRPPGVVHLHEAVGLLDQDFLGQIGMTEEIEGLGAEPEAQRIAVLMPPHRHDLQRAPFEPA